MSATITAPADTIAELLARLGDIPPERVRLIPTPGQATEQDVLAAQVRYGSLYELVDGTLVEKGMGYYESWLASLLIHQMVEFVTKKDLGIVLGEAGMTRLGRQVRLPDVAFYSWRHFSSRLLPHGQILDVAPDLAVEILSPSNTGREMERKRREYFAGGSQIVWEIFPDARLAHVYTDVDTFTVADETHTLSGEPALPGFVVVMRNLFAAAGERETAD